MSSAFIAVEAHRPTLASQCTGLGLFLQVLLQQVPEARRGHRRPRSPGRRQCRRRLVVVQLRIKPILAHSSVAFRQMISHHHEPPSHQKGGHIGPVSPGFRKAMRRNETLVTESLNRFLETVHNSTDQPLRRPEVVTDLPCRPELTHTPPPCPYLDGANVALKWPTSRSLSFAVQHRLLGSRPHAALLP